MNLISINSSVPSARKNGLGFNDEAAHHKPNSMPDVPQDLVPTRRSLLTRLKQWDDQEGWQRFFDTYWKLIFTVALRAGLSNTEAEDVVQETMMSVARQMPEFKYDPRLGSFKSWLFLLTHRRITDHLRKQYRRIKTHEPAPGATPRTAILESIPDTRGSALDAMWEEEWKRQMFEAALGRVKHQVEPKHFQIFDCYVIKEWPVKEVSQTFGISTGQVYLIKHRLSALLADEVKSLAAAQA